MGTETRSQVIINLLCWRMPVLVLRGWSFYEIIQNALIQGVDDMHRRHFVTLKKGHLRRGCHLFDVTLGYLLILDPGASVDPGAQVSGEVGDTVM